MPDSKKEQPKTNKPTPSQLMLAETKLNQAAKDLLEQLPDHAGQLVHSLAKQFQMPLWQYACGILLAVHLEGRLSEFRVDPAWKAGLKTKELKCKYCGSVFTPRHINQPYCSNECGLAATGPKPKKEPKPNVAVNVRAASPDNIPSGGVNSNWSAAAEGV